MMSADVFAGSSSLINQLTVLALRGLVLGGVAGMALVACRVKSAPVRLFTWTTVLYAALAMPLLGRIVPPMALPQIGPVNSDVAVRPASMPSSEVASALRQSMSMVGAPASGLRSPVSGTPVLSEPSGLGHRKSAWNLVSWRAVAIRIYLGGLLVLMTRIGIGVMMTRRLLRGSQRIDSALTQSELPCDKALGVSFVPQVRECPAATVPVTIGVLRPVILLPSGWREWERTKLEAVIAHEVSHVARRDSLTQHLALLYRAIFWFSPFAWWLHRQLMELAEQASDEAVLRFGANRTDYARTLLQFFESLEAAPGRVWWQGVAMAKSGQAERRVEKILSGNGAFDMALKQSVAVAIIILAIPVVYLAASLQAAGHGTIVQQPAVPPAPQAAPSPRALPAPASAPSVAPDPAVAPEPGTAPEAAPDPALAPAAPEALVLPAPPAAALAGDPETDWAGQSRSSYRVGDSYFGSDDEERFVIVRAGTESLTMSGDSEDAHHVQRLRKRISGSFIWFDRDEKPYIIRDQATVDRALKLWAPQEELGKKQEELGKKQEELGKQQEAIGKRMEEVRVKLPDMTAQLDKLRAEMKQLSAGATQEQIGNLQSEIGELQSRIGEIQSQAGGQQSKIGEEMGALGQKQGELGRQQGELGRQQGELAREASRRMKELIDEALKNGKALPEPSADDHGTI